ncbi:MAG: VanZ family protein [Paenisporosarcina sp.]
MDLILGYLKDMWLYMGITTPIIIVFRMYKVKKLQFTINFVHEIGVILFFIYLVGLLSQTIIPAITITNGSIFLVNGNFQATNLEFFRVLTETYNAIKYLDLWEPFFINFLGNIVMFMPIGFLLPLLWEKFEPFYITIGLGFLLSLSIEILQLPQMRSSDVDDLWLNTLGTIIGYIVFVVIPKRIRTKFKFQVSG